MEREVAEPQNQKLLEKVGLKKVEPLPLLNEDVRSEISQSSADTTNSNESAELIRSDLLTGFSLGFQQFLALLKKRWLHSIRDWRYLLTIVVLPAFLLAISLLLGLLKPSDDSPPLLMTPSIYGPDSNVFLE